MINTKMMSTMIIFIFIIVAITMIIKIVKVRRSGMLMMIMMLMVVMMMITAIMILSDHQVSKDLPPLLRGVIQGDPISPTLFTAAILELFNNAQLGEKEIKVDGEDIR